MTDSKEIERVLFIHAELDKASAWYAKQHPSYDGALFIVPEYSLVEHRYTAIEVRAWPEMKAKIRADWNAYAASSASILCITAGISGKDGELYVSLANARDLERHEATKAAVARGLCFYREMLEGKPAEKIVTDPCAVCGAEACDNPLSAIGNCFRAHGRMWRLCKVCWSGRNGDTLQLRDVIYERHIKPKEAQAKHDELADKLDAALEHQRELNKRIWTPDGTPRVWDSDKYNDLDAVTYQQLSTLDKRITAVKAEHAKSDASAGLLHPREWWSGRRGGRRV